MAVEVSYQETNGRACELSACTAVSFLQQKSGFTKELCVVWARQLAQEHPDSLLGRTIHNLRGNGK